MFRTKETIAKIAEQDAYHSELNKIKEFIEEPYQNYPQMKVLIKAAIYIDEENKQAMLSHIEKNIADLIKKTGECLQKSPEFILSVLTEHVYVSTSDLCSYLSAKIREGYGPDLENFFDQHKVKLLNNSIYHVYDIEKFANAFPSRTKEIRELINKDSAALRRLENALPDEKNTIVYERLAEKFPALNFEGQLAGLCFTTQALSNQHVLNA